MHTRRRVLRTATASAFAALLAGCAPAPEGNEAGPGDEGARACTMIGCSDGLSVRLGSDYADARAVEVVGPGEVTRRVTCGGGRSCTGGLFFEDFTADRVTVRVERPSGTVERSFDLAYRDVRPNGPGCLPVCSQTEVVVTGRAPLRDPR